MAQATWQGHATNPTAPADMQRPAAPWVIDVQTTDFTPVGGKRYPCMAHPPPSDEGQTMFLCRGPDPQVPPGPSHQTPERGVGLNSAIVWDYFNELDVGGNGDCCFTAYGAVMKFSSTGPGPFPTAGPRN